MQLQSERCSSKPAAGALKMQDMKMQDRKMWFQHYSYSCAVLY